MLSKYLYLSADKTTGERRSLKVHFHIELISKALLHLIAKLEILQYYTVSFVLKWNIRTRCWQGKYI